MCRWINVGFVVIFMHQKGGKAAPRNETVSRFPFAQTARTAEQNRGPLAPGRLGVPPPGLTASVGLQRPLVLKR